MKKLILCMLLILFLGGCQSTENIPEGYSLYKERDISFTFFYPNNYNVLVTDNSEELPIITITTEKDPTYYYVITGGQNDLVEEHFEKAYKAVDEAIIAQAGGGILSYDEFFEISETEELIGNRNAIVKTFTSIVPDVYFINSFYKFNSDKKEDCSFVVFYSATSDNKVEKDIILNSIEFKK